jgi:hypothetical protein
MARDRSDESWRDAALLLDMMLAAEDALSFVAGVDERAFFRATSIKAQTFANSKSWVRQLERFPYHSAPRMTKFPGRK